MNNPTTSNYSTLIVGGQFRHGVNWSKLKRGQPVIVLADPMGEYTKTKHGDPNALAVFVTQGDNQLQIGYFPKEVASILGPHVNAGLLRINGVLSWFNGPSNIHVDYTLETSNKNK